MDLNPQQEEWVPYSNLILASGWSIAFGFDPNT
jgi:hypothetical protein